MESLAGWLAPVATAIAAVMTASNLGPRMTGWGFVVFVFGSISWCAVALATDQSNLLWANGFLTLVNLIGVWRWLGRQARYARGGALARARSADAATPTLAPLSGLVGAAVVGSDGKAFGQVVEAMVRCDTLQPDYLVVSIGGVAGVGETLHALGDAEFDYAQGQVRSRLSRVALERRRALTAGDWPMQLRDALGESPQSRSLRFDRRLRAP
ncbi:PRC-barrel domain containing protein [Brevundimonas sp.]|jgi:hypothetical protein|uniref:PRC-barrel domain containing protein n=1 Tax=Brevundimonas sp. TaxID=1871086 RepID=UPI0037C000BF